MKVLVSGSSGLVGSALMENLQADGHEVGRLPRTFEQAIDFSGVGAVVHLAGESIAEGRWTDAKKKRIEESRVSGTRQLAEQLASSSSKPAVFICASAIGFYGDRADETLDEASSAGSGFLPDVCKNWEAAAKPAADAGIRTVWIRTGIVLSKKGGALNKMLPPFKMGAGGILGNGRQYMSWISLEDEIGAICFSIENAVVSGPVNLVAPNPATNLEFTKALGKALHRPTILPMPAFAVRLLFGEMGDALLLGSTRVLPKKLIEAGYEFCHPDLQSALEDVLR
ncbi:TIGR01777 family oxidoreductase [Pontiella sulfatireligans]|uniref:Epimerase family protein n=1 Tax=Pontiella sulfatireligans TaxID=2750658 RepID=A0A6C2UQ89_9BACT|nr:TIGR01777 family oxidoreductase [Pontiella sulfatireligans]VGO22103.1 Epimerase family protein [Pontiella sulfatireligans]